MNVMSKRKVFSKLQKSQKKYGLFVIGLIALIWFLVRVIPKPSRATYPCQRAAFPIASGFVIWLISALSIKIFFKKFRQKLSQANYLYASILFILCLFTSGILLFTPSLRSISATVFSVQEEFIPIDSPNTPVGEARGIFPGRVVWSHNPDATSWDGETGFWWESSETNKSIDSLLVRTMLSRSLLKLTGAASGPEAWDSIFVYYNSTHGRGQLGYSPGEKIVIKANFNTQQSHTQMDNDIFSSPAVVLSLLRLLINEGGVPDSAITVYDITRYVPDLIYNDCKKDFPMVHFIDISGGENGREPFTLDIAKPIQWSDSVDGQTTYLPLHVTGADYMINIANLKGHSLAGVTMHAKNHFGTYACDATGKGGPVISGAHRYVAVHEFEDNTLGTLPERPMGSYSLLTDLMGHEDLGEKTILFIIDALYTTGRQHVNVSLDYKMQMPPFNDDWMSSIFVSLDGVAIESVGLDFLRSETGAVGTEMIYGQVDNYLHEAAQANNPPSGIIYDPEGDGTACISLGVHEHWNDPINKQYSRNLKTGEGIELVDDSLIDTTGTFIRINTNKGFEIVMYPNPVRNEATIEIRNAVINGDLKVQIYTMSGTIVDVFRIEKNTREECFTIDLSNLVSGSYICLISDNHSSERISFIKQ